MPEPMDRLTAALAGRYRIERQLGSGGMATVYLAEDLKHHRQVALKVLRPELAAMLGPERFLREIEIAAKLNHPHILPLFDSGQADGVLYYVMPYVAGESLRDRLNREKQLAIEDALQIAREVADALDYAHRQGVVHRDIKPENILLEERHAVVADFGIARAISVAGGEKLTATGVAAGTAEYMSPEQASGRGELDGRSDIYALGCVAYEMLAGEPPFTGPTVEAVLRQHLTAPAQAVTLIRAAVPTSATSAIQRALAKTPADRFASAAQFGDAITQRTASTPAWWQSKRAAAIAALSLLVLVAAGYWALGRGRGGRDSGAARTLPRLAVLPFENLGAPEDEFFADGITDEILTKLAGLKRLAVIAPQSAMKYKGTQKAPGQIGKELGVQYLLQGRIRYQRAVGGPSRVRVTPRLIRVTDDTHVWASDFDEVLEDVFRVQGQIAIQVANALGVALLGGEQEALAGRPTQNLGAYEQYLRGNAFFRTGFCCGPPLRDAIVAYENAIALDSGFATAYARLSIAYGAARWGDIDPGRGEEYLAKQGEYADRALSMDGDLPEGHLAMGWYRYWGHRDYKTALQEFKIALAAEPNNSFFISAEATIDKRTGEFAAAAERIAQASDLDPLTPAPAGEAFYPFVLLRRYDEVERFLERLATIRGSYHHLAYVRLARDGNPRALQAWLDTTLGSTGFPQFIAGAAHGGSFTVVPFWALIRVLCGECDAAIPLVPSLRERDWQRYLAIAVLHERAGRLDEATVYYDSARVRQEEVGGLPFWAYAKLGRKDAAVRGAKLALERARENKDALLETTAMQGLAEVSVIVGDYDSALAHLEWLLGHPSYLSVPVLRVDPLWDPLRNNPRFQALLAKYETEARR